MMVVFLGPSLARERAEALLRGTEAVLLPPAAQGDIYRAARRRPAAIALIDGYFSGAPAVWHKEILWALKEGIPVVGAASMGALRAAELEPFGMVGIGAIFEAYRDGRLVDDDEVALIHAPAELSYVPLSEPMVNIRATFAAALAAGVIPAATHDAALRIGREIHYTERSCGALLRRMAAEGQALHGLPEWLPGGRVDQKARDAEALLQVLENGVELPATTAGWHFEHTAMWDELVRLHGTPAATPHPGWADTVLRRLQHEPERWRAALDAAIGRMLASDAARREGKHVRPEELLAALAQLRRSQALESPAALGAWLAANDLDTDALIELLANQVRLDWMVASLEADLEPHLLEHLKLTGAYREVLPAAAAETPASAPSSAPGKG